MINLRDAEAQMGQTPPPQSTQPMAPPPPIYHAPVSQSMPKPMTPKPAPVNNNPHGQFFSGNILNKAFDVLLSPYYAISGFNKGSQQVSNALTQQAHQTGQSALQKFGPKAILDTAMGGIKGILPGLQNRTQIGRETGDYNAGAYLTKNPIGQEAFNFTASMGAPSLPLGPVAKVAGKVINKLPLATKLTGEAANLGTKAMQIARKTPVIANVAEKFNPFFKNPEMGKMVQAADQRTNERLIQLSQMVTKAAKGLSPAEQARVGQLLEGGIATNPANKYYQIAKPISDFADQVGKEAVDLGLMSPESYNKYKGQYMSHVWNEQLQKGTGNFFGKTKVVPTVSGQFYKKRTGAEGYIKQFAPAVYKGLGTQIHDIETTKLMKNIGDKFGQYTPPIKSSQGVAKDLINTLLKEYRAPRSGLGDIPVEQTGAYKESMLPVIDFLKKKLPALSATPLDNGQAVRLGTKLTTGGMGRLYQEVTKTIKDTQNPIASARPFTARAAKAVQGYVTGQLSHIRETASSTGKMGEGIDSLVQNVLQKAQGDKQVLAGLRTAINKEMYGIVGSTGNYRSDYAALMGMMKHDPEVGPLLTKMQDHVLNLDNMLLSPVKQAQIAEKTALKAGTTVTKKLLPQGIPANPGAPSIDIPALSHPGIPATPGMSVPTEGIVKTELGNVAQGLPETKVSRPTLNPEKPFREMPEGYQYAPESVTNSKTGQILKDVALPQSVIEQINQIRKTDKPGMFDKAMGLWKAGKTIWNPAYHIRNVLSNQILSDMSTGKGLLPTVVDYVGAVRNYMGHGNQKFVSAAENAGLIKKGNFISTLNDFLDSAGLAHQQTTAQKIVGKVKIPHEFLAKIQNVSEETSKLNVFKSWVEKIATDGKMTIDQALKDPKVIEQAGKKAEEAIFSPYRISSTERSLAKRVIPFYAFGRQALPFTVKTGLNNPGRLTKYEKIKTGIEGLSPEAANQDKNLPDNLKGQIRLPIKDKQGNNTYFDPTYIYPFGNFQDAGFNQGQLPMGFGINPLLSEPFEQGLNRDAYFNQDIAKSNIPSRAMGQRVEHAARTFLPQLYTTIKGKLQPAFSNQLDYAGRERSKSQAVLDALGLKSAVYRPSEQAQFDSMDKNAKIKSIQSERRSLMKNQSIPAKEKQQLLKQLNQVMQQTLTATP